MVFINVYSKKHSNITLGKKKKATNCIQLTDLNSFHTANLKKKMTIGNIFMFLNILIFLNSSIGLNVLTSSETNELALYKYLTNGYNNKVRPARIPKTTVLVELTLYINQVLVVDEKNQMIQTFLSMNAVSIM